MTRRDAVVSQLWTAASRSSFACSRAARMLSDGSQAIITCIPHTPCFSVSQPQDHHDNSGSPPQHDCDNATDGVGTF